MDDIRRLENQISQLQRELDNQNREMNRMRQQAAEENRRRLADYERQMRSGLNQHDKSVQKEYERLLREYQTSLNSEIQDAQLQMNEDYRRLRTSVDEKEREWREKNQQLERLISDLKKNADQKEQIGEEEARKYMSEAGMAQMEVERKPHEKFFPKRINAFRTAISDASELSRRGLREAAIAIYISARSGLNRLGFDVDEQFAEWMRQYEIFKSKIELLELRLEDELSEWNRFALGVEKNNESLSKAEIDQADASINFWSEGEYLNIWNRVQELKNQVTLVEEIGPMQYLRKPESMDIDSLRNAIIELDSLGNKWQVAGDLYKAKYSAACERADWGEKIIDFLEDEINLTWVETESHFKYVDADKAEKPEYDAYMNMQYGSPYEKEDTRQWLELVFNNSMETVIFVYIVPYEKGIKVENRIVLYIDYNGAVNEEYSRHIYQHICESISLEDDGTINFASDVDQLRTNMNTTLRETGRSIEKKIQRMR